MVETVRLFLGGGMLSRSSLCPICQLDIRKVLRLVALRQQKEHGPKPGYEAAQQRREGVPSPSNCRHAVESATAVIRRNLQRLRTAPEERLRECSRPSNNTNVPAPQTRLTPAWTRRTISRPPPEPRVVSWKRRSAPDAVNLNAPRRETVAYESGTRPRSPDIMVPPPPLTKQPVRHTAPPIAAAAAVKSRSRTATEKRGMPPPPSQQQVVDRHAGMPHSKGTPDYHHLQGALGHRRLQKARPPPPPPPLTPAVTSPGSVTYIPCPLIAAHSTFSPPFRMPPPLPLYATQPLQTVPNCHRMGHRRDTVAPASSAGGCKSSNQGFLSHGRRPAAAANLKTSGG